MTTLKYHLASSLILFGLLIMSIQPELHAEDDQKPLYGIAGILVLSDGVVVHGIIHKTAIGYLVEMDKGKRAIPASRVFLHAKNKKSAYKQFSKLSSTINVPARLKLAHWCLRNHLLKETGKELKGILILQPENYEAKELLKKLEVKLDPDHPSHLKNATQNSRRMNDTDLVDIHFIGDLPRGLAKTYTSKIQPILLSQCGNIKCHGSQNQEFYLNHATKKIRRYSNDNIQSVFNQINWDSPEKSPLLTVHQNNQNKNRYGEFRGRSGRKQKELLEKWISKVVSYRDDNPTFQVKEPSHIAKVSAKSVVENKTSVKEPRLFNKKMTEDSVLKKALKSVRNDPFSPNEFNLNNHGRK